MRYAIRQRAGFTLIELLMVIALVGILAALVIPSADSAINDHLRGAARIVATDLAYAQSLAVMNNSTYRVAFDVKRNRYTLEHSGDAPGFDVLPESPFSRHFGGQKQMVVALDELPGTGAQVRLEAVSEYSTGWWPNRRDASELAFDTYGQPATPRWTVIWLGAGSGERSRYTWLIVHPITGLVEVGRAHGEKGFHVASSLQDAENRVRERLWHLNIATRLPIVP